MGDISDGPWFASEPHPTTGATVITNGQGRMIATVPNAADAAFICRVRDEQVGITSVQIDWTAFGREVEKARKARRQKQGVAAQLCGISRNYMHQIERGIAANPSYVVVLTLCLWLGLELPKPSDRP